MIKKDFHVHSTFSDGRNSPEEIVLYAIGKGMEEIGFSDHSYTFFFDETSMRKERINDYVKEINLLKEKYKDKITVKCGIEQEYYSTESTDAYDYVIGSVHYLFSNGKYVAIDLNKENFTDVAEKYFGGDYYALSEEYFKTVAKFSERKDVGIIGHFDLVAKYNEKNALFDENDDRYVSAAKRAAEKLVSSGKVFEINTGGIKRGYRSDAYPAKNIRDYIKSIGGKFILSSDAHDVSGLMFGFSEYENI